MHWPALITPPSMSPLDSAARPRVPTTSDLISSKVAPGRSQFFTQAFCTTCGGKTPRHDADRGIAVAALGTFDDDPGMHPQRHIFTGSKAPWFEITDGLPQDAGAPPPA